MSICRRAIAAVLLATLPLAGARAGAQEVYPSRPIKIVVPFTPGGATDSVARLIAANLKEKLGQTVYVENKGGGGTIIGTDLVAKSAADGYTLLMLTPPFAVNHSLYPDRPYDTFEDFVPVVGVASLPLVLIVQANSPVKTVKDLVELAKKNPGKLSYGSAGNGSGTHLAMEMLKSSAGVDIRHIPYRGSLPSLTDLLARQTDAIFDTILLVTPYVTSGKVHALAQTGAKRSSYLPEVPTMQEAGISGYEAVSWLAFAAPAGTPAAVVQKLNAAVNEILESPSVRKQLERQGLEIIGGTPEDAARHLKKEVEKFAAAVKSSGAKPQ